MKINTPRRYVYDMCDMCVFSFLKVEGDDQTLVSAGNLSDHWDYLVRGQGQTVGVTVLRSNITF